MSFKTKRIIKWWLFAIVSAAIAGSILLVILRQNPLRAMKNPLSSSKSAYGEGFTIHEVKGDKKVYRVTIGSFSIERAKLGPFAIGPLQKAHLNKVHIDLYSDGVSAKAGKKENRHKAGEEKNHLLAARGWGLVYTPIERSSGDDKTGEGKNHIKMGGLGVDNLEGLMSKIKSNLSLQRVKVKSLEIAEITLSYWEEENKIFKISSDRATIDRKSGDIIFVGHASLDAGENGTLKSHRIRWVRKTTLFLITDAYIFTKGKEKKEGRGIETDYLLKEMNNQITN